MPESTRNLEQCLHIYVHTQRHTKRDTDTYRHTQTQRHTHAHTRRCLCFEENLGLNSGFPISTKVIFFLCWQLCCLSLHYTALKENVQIIITSLTNKREPVMAALKRLGADSVKQLSSSVVDKRDPSVPKVTCSKDKQSHGSWFGTTATRSP